MICEKCTNFNDCELVIFDLDGTLHSFDDIYNDDAILKSHILDILSFLKKKDIKIALASLNTTADKFLDKYNIRKYFDYIEYKNWIVYGDFKTDLFKYIHEKSKIPYEKMLFFDDNFTHCTEASFLKIKNIKVDKDKLLSLDDFHKGLNLFIKTKTFTVTVGTQTNRRHFYKNKSQKNKKRKITVST